MAKLDLNIGAQVHCIDQPYGKLVKLVVDLQTQQVTDLIVEKGLLIKHDRVLPVATVDRITEKEIYLNIHSNELNNYPEYRAVNITEPAFDGRERAILASEFGSAIEPAIPQIRKRVHEGIAAGKTVIGRGTDVENLHHVLGHVDHVVVDQQSGRITHIVLQRGFWSENVVIPAERLENVDENGVFVSLTDAEVSELPRYKPRPASEILADLQDRLHDEWPPVFPEVKADMEGGVVHLSGSVGSKPLQIHAMEMARMVEGVIDVQNDLVITPNTQHSYDNTNFEEFTSRETTMLHKGATYS